jgi:hypothetical protein
VGQCESFLLRIASWIATSLAYPPLSGLAPTWAEARAGLEHLISDIEADVWSQAHSYLQAGSAASPDAEEIKMRFLARTTILGTAALAMFVALSANAITVAHADNDIFLSQIKAAGVNNGDLNGAEIGVGYGICREADAGLSQAQAAESLWKTSKLDQQQAAQFVSIAIRDLCPDKA